METLKNFCLRNICGNLQLNYSIILNVKKWNIPLEIRNSIYLFYCKNIENIIEKDLEIFSTLQFSISTLIINEKFFKFPQFFSKINRNIIKEIKVNLQDRLNCLEILLQNPLPNVEIFNIMFSMECSFCYDLKNEKEINKTMSLISSNLGDNLTEFRMKYEKIGDVPKKICGNLLNILEKNRNLKIFEIPFYGKNEFSEMKKLSFNLEKLCITISRETNSEEIFQFFQNFTNLTTLSINLLQYYEIGEKLYSAMKGLFRSKESLEKLEIICKESLNSEFLKYILENFQSLQEFHLCDENENCNAFKMDNRNKRKLSRMKVIKSDMSLQELQNVIDCLKHQNITLDEIEMKRIRVKNTFDENVRIRLVHLSKLAKTTKVSMRISFNKDAKRFFSSIQDLENINFNFDFDFRAVMNESFLFDIESFLSCNFITALKFPIIEIETIENYNWRKFFSKFKHLTILDFYQAQINNVFDDICIGLSFSGNTLESLNLSGCDLGGERNKNNLTSLIRNNRSLKVLKIDENKDDFVDETVLKEIKSSLSHNLTELAISYDKKLIPQLFITLKSLKKLKIFLMQIFKKDISDENSEKFSNILSEFQNFRFMSVLLWEKNCFKLK